MNVDRGMGYVDIALGKTKELVGWVFRHPDLQFRGQHDQVVGHARATYGNAIAAVLRRSHHRSRSGGRAALRPGAAG